MPEDINVSVQDAQPINVSLEGFIGSIPTRLGDLLDVLLSAAANNESWVYDLATSKWVNRKMHYYDLDYECFILVD